MKNCCLILAVAALLTSIVPNSQARYVTVYLNDTNQLREINIEAYETARVATCSDPAGFAQVTVETAAGKLVARASTGSYDRTPGYGGFGASPFVLTGPATFKFNDFGFFTGRTNTIAILTLEITPDTYPPDKAITLAPGQGGAAVSLESSTNLLQWSSATNGVYTNLNEAVFFRIKADRIK